MEYVNRDEALKITNITTRQGLSKFAKKHNIRTKRECNGKPTFYCKEDLLKGYAQGYSNKVKHNPTLEQKAQKERQVKEQKAQKQVEERKKAIEKKGKVLDDIGQEELLRVEKILKNKGIYDDLDRTILLRYAIAYQNYIYYITLSKELQHISVDMAGNEKVGVYLNVAEKFFKQMENAENKLGIGINNRRGLDFREPTNDSLMAELLSS